MKRTIFIFALLIATGLTLFGQYVADAQLTAKQVAHAQEDNRLFNQMTKVSDWLAQYCTWNHRFPEGWEQVAFAKQQLNQLVPNIPYQSGSLQLAQGLDDQSTYATPDQSPVDTPQPVPVAANMDRIHGDVAYATYRNHGGHAEAIEITSTLTDSSAICWSSLQIHDPTTRTARATTSRSGRPSSTRPKRRGGPPRHDRRRDASGRGPARSSPS